MPSTNCLRMSFFKTVNIILICATIPRARPQCHNSRKLFDNCIHDIHICRGTKRRTNMSSSLYVLHAHFVRKTHKYVKLQSIFVYRPARGLHIRYFQLCIWLQCIWEGIKSTTYLLLNHNQIFLTKDGNQIRNKLEFSFTYHKIMFRREYIRTLYLQAISLHQLWFLQFSCLLRRLSGCYLLIHNICISLFKIPFIFKKF